MIIYLARHGQTTGDIENRYGGAYDDHLTDEGKHQAAKLAEQLQGKGIEKLYASPLIRAQETAAIVGKKLELKPATLEDFRERNSYGPLTGLTKIEAEEKYADQVEILKDFHAAIDGAEEYPYFQARIKEALDALAHENADTVAVVTHGGPFKIIFREILKLGEIDVANCAHAVLEAKDNQYRLLEMQEIVISSRQVL